MATEDGLRAPATEAIAIVPVSTMCVSVAVARRMRAIKLARKYRHCCIPVCADELLAVRAVSALIGAISVVEMAAPARASANTALLSVGDPIGAAAHSPLGSLSAAVRATMDGCRVAPTR